MTTETRPIGDPTPTALNAATAESGLNSNSGATSAATSAAAVDAGPPPWPAEEFRYRVGWWAWAKSGAVSVSLTDHHLHAAAVAQAILGGAWGEWISARTGLSRLELSLLCGLHDLGKSAQWGGRRAALAPEGALGELRRQIARTLKEPLVASHHAALSEAYLGALSGERSGLWRAVGAHHGAPLDPHDAPLGQLEQLAASIQAQAVWQAIRPDGSEDKVAAVLKTMLRRWHADPVSEALLGGLIVTCDWIASGPLTERLKPGDTWRAQRAGKRSEDAAQELRALFADARGWADQALNDIDWQERTALKFATAEPRPVETLARREARRGLHVLRAPAGSGKTNAALGFAQAVQAIHPELRGAHITLPNRAAGQGVWTVLRRQHKGARLIQSGAGAWQGRWRGQGRALFSPLGTGTIDQLLLAGTVDRFSSLRLLALSQRVIIIDEAHAPQPYDSQLLRALMPWLRALDCTVLLMSASLDAAEEAALVRAWFSEVGAQPSTEPGRPVEAGQAARTPPEHTVSWHVWSSPDQLQVSGAQQAVPGAPRIGDLSGDLEEAARTLRISGASGAVLSYVRAAQELGGELLRRRQLGETVAALHGGLSARERRRREDDLAARLGPGDEPGRLCLRVVATDVLGVSLDLDFDLLISDATWPQVMRQRSGRLGRHARPDREPTLLVIPPGRWGAPHLARDDCGAWALREQRRRDPTGQWLRRSDPLKSWHPDGPEETRRCSQWTGEQARERQLALSVCRSQSARTYSHPREVDRVHTRLGLRYQAALPLVWNGAAWCVARLAGPVWTPHWTLEPLGGALSPEALKTPPETSWERQARWSGLLDDRWFSARRALRPDAISSADLGSADLGSAASEAWAALSDAWNQDFPDEAPLWACHAPQDLQDHIGVRAGPLLSLRGALCCDPLLGLSLQEEHWHPDIKASAQPAVGADIGSPVNPEPSEAAAQG